MPLKLKKSQASPESSSAKDDFCGPWGRINPDPESVVVLRLCKKTSPSTEETHSYPYRALSCWHWRGAGENEELRINAGSDLVTVKGRGLYRLVEALDRNSLELLREVSTDAAMPEGFGIQIVSITVAVFEESR